MTEAIFSYSDVEMDQRHMLRTDLSAECRGAMLNIQWHNQKHSSVSRNSASTQLHTIWVSH